MTRPLRIFLSSPGDVAAERLRAQLIVQKLARDYARFFKIELYLWEYEPMLASGTFQDAIDPPSQSDIVVLVVYSRLGTPLPERTRLRTYSGIDGRRPVTGTEWEFEDALAANIASGAPDLLAYRRAGDPGASLIDAARRAEQEQQWQALDTFWRRHFEDKGVFLAGSSRYEGLEEFDRRLEIDLKTLIERRAARNLTVSTTAEAPAWLKGSPFRGLSAYEFQHAPIFFGRETATRKALTRLQDASTQGCAFLAVIGASGSGKSSLARAGLLPALVAPLTVESVGLWRRVVMRPGQSGSDPFESLATALLEGDPIAGEGLPEIAGPGVAPADLVRHMRASADEASLPIRQALGALAATHRASGRLLAHEQVRLVLLVDQFEELVTLPGILPADRALFIRMLAGLARSGVVWIVATLRSDLWHAASAVPGFVDFVEAGARIDLEPPEGSELIEVIRQPAAAAGLEFGTDPDSGTRLDAMLAAAASRETRSLPLLSVMLDALYERDIKQEQAAGQAATELRVQTYRALGELSGAIAERAEGVLARLTIDDPEAANALPTLLRGLVTIGQGGSAITSRAASLAQFKAGSPERRLVDALLASEARLLVAESQGSQTIVRVAHEALIANWPRAVTQLQRDRRDIETRARLEALLEGWRTAARADRKRALLDGLSLQEGLDLAVRWQIAAGEPLGGFIEASARRARWRRIRAIMASVAFIVALAVSGSAWFAIDQQRRTEAALAVSQSEMLRAREAADATQRQTELTRQAEASAREARVNEALSTANAGRADEARKSELIAQADRIAALSQQLANADRINLAAAVALSAAPEGLANDRPMTDRLEVALRRSLTATQLPLQRDVEQNIIAMAISPDGRVVALGTVAGMVHVVDTKTMEELFQFTNGTDWVSALHFSPDSERLVATGGAVPVVWNVSTKLKLFDLSRPNRRSFATDVRFSPDGSRILVGTAENSAFVHDARDGALLFVLPGALAEEIEESFKVLEGKGRRSPPLWRMAHGNFGTATSAMFSPDGKWIALTGPGSVDGTVLLYDAGNGTFVRRLWGGESAAFSIISPGFGSVISFSGDSSSLIASQRNQPIKVWDVIEGRLKIELPSHDHATFVLTSDGRAVLSGQDNGAIIARCIDGRLLVESLQAHSAAVETLGMDPSGTFLISGSRDRSAQVWRMPIGADVCSTNIGRARLKFSQQRPLAVFAGHYARVTGAAFSEDLARVVTTSQDGFVRNWRIRPADVMQFAVSADLPLNIANMRDRSGRLRSPRIPNEASEKYWTKTASMRESFVVSGDGKRFFVKPLFEWHGFDLETGRPLAIPNQMEAIAPGGRGKPALMFYTPTDAFELEAIPADVKALSTNAKVRLAGSDLISPDGATAVARSLDAQKDEPDRLIDSQSGAELAVLEHDGKRAGPAGYAYSADGTRLLVRLDGDSDPLKRKLSDGLAVWDTRTGALLASIESIKDNSILWRLEPSHNGGRFLLSADGKSPRVFEILDGAITELKFGQTGAGFARARDLTAATLSPDGRSLLAGHSDGYVSIVGIGENREFIGAFDTRGAPIVGVSFAPDGRHFAVADESRTVWIFDRERLDPLRSLTLKHDVYFMRFTPDSRRLIAGDITHSFEVLPVTALVAGLSEIQDMIDWARAVRLAIVDEENGRRYGLAAPPRTSRPDLDAIKPQPTAVPPKTQPPGPAAAACDRLAANPFDRRNRANGVAFDKLDAVAARPVCSQARAEYPDDLVTAYQVARIEHRLSRLEAALEGYTVLSAQGYASASWGIANLIQEDATGELGRRLGTAVSWGVKAAGQGLAPLLVYALAGEIAVGPEGRSRMPEILALLSSAGIENRASAATAAFLRAASRAQSKEQKSAVLFFGLLGLQWADTVDDPAPPQFEHDRKLALEIVRDYGVALPPATVVKAYRDARDWRASSIR